MPTLKEENISRFSQDGLFQKISDICINVNGFRDSEELLDFSLQQILELFGARRGSIFILNESKKELDLQAVRGMAVVEQKNMVKRLGEGVVGRVAQIKEPVVVEDIAKDSRFKNYKPRGSYRTPSFICAPLLVKDQLIGVINLADKESGSRFNHNELQLLDFLASQVALNYRRIQLYQKFKTILKESKVLKNELGKTSAETKNLKKQIEVQEKFALIGKLAGGIAHEFNNPLDGVIRYTNLSLQHIKDDEVVRGYLLEVKHGLNRMANIVKSLLACSRSANPTLRTIDINQKIDQAISGVQEEIEHKKIHFEKKLVADVTPVVDLGIELVVSNLLRNAVDAVNLGGEIKITTRYVNGLLTIKVQDNGCGIPHENLEKIFEPFFTTKDIDKGCGLGLTIVGEIVRGYNGQIQVESIPGKGTSFFINLPVNYEYSEEKS